ncbi:MAG: mechanosensitive ion channel family protein [Gammaproteobacteria bacterium]
MKTDMSWLDPLFWTLEQFLQDLVNFVPTLLSAVAVLAAGIVVGLMLKVIVFRISDGVAVIIARSTGSQRTRLIRVPWPIPVILANAIFWLTLVYFFSVSLRVLGLSEIADSITQAASFLPQIFIALVILFSAYLIASISRESISRMPGETETFATLIFLLINAIAILAALRQLGIDLVLVRGILLIVVAAAFGGIAFAFGQGASNALQNIVASHYIARIYRAGQRVRIGQVEGEIFEITPIAVVIDSPSGRTMIPALKFNQEISVLLGKEAQHGGT